MSDRERQSTLEKRLQFLANASSVVSFGALLYILRYKLEVGQFFPSFAALRSVPTWSNFLNKNGAALFLAACAIFWLFAWRRAYTREFSIGASLFSKSRTPMDFTTMRGARAWPMMAIIFNAAFVAMSWFIDSVRAFSVGILTIAVIDIASTWMTRANLRKYLLDSRYSPSPGDEHREFILRRRNIAEAYVFGRPHGTRQLVIMLLAIVAIVAAWSTHTGSFSVLTAIAYTAIGLIVFGNEILVARWRAVRDDALATVEDDQITRDRRRLGED